MTRPGVAVLSGGLGGARVALALQAEGLESAAVFVTNIGDDLDIGRSGEPGAQGGLLVCPDTDAVLYALAGRFDEERGWGVLGDTFSPPREGEPEWFHVGDLDRRHHERRAALLDEGHGLAGATARLATELGVRARVVPVTGDPVRTRVVAAGGVLGWQEWLVREQAGPVPVAVEFRGAERADANAEALDALSSADLVVVAPSSPVGSIAPMLAVEGVSDALATRRGPFVVVSPVVARRSPTLARDRHRAAARAALLAAGGYAHDPAGVARWFAERFPGALFVLDPADADDASAVRDAGLVPRVAPADTTSVDGLRALVTVLATEHHLPEFGHVPGA